MKTKTLLFVLLIIPITVTAQIDSILSKLSFTGDFRFRVEQDWDSRKSDGSFRDDRTRLRYRIRLGAQYKDKWYKTGFRLRTGNPIKQQDPQLTLGDGSKEFGTLPIGFEKAYFHGDWDNFGFGLGKTDFPFEKSNELFWSGNVFPEGVFLWKNFLSNTKSIDKLSLQAGHFIIASAGTSFQKDAYMQGYQTYISILKKRFEFFPSLYLFRNIANIPDGGGSYTIDYSITHLGTRYRLLKQSSLQLELDYYYNLQDYSKDNAIAEDLKEQKTGMALGLSYGQLQKKGDCFFKASYAKIEQYAVVDVMAQNDWARWDYSTFGSPDGRLSNFQGIELVASIKLDKKTSLTMKYYWVEQLVAYGEMLETGSRIRFDLDIKL